METIEGAPKAAQAAYNAKPIAYYDRDEAVEYMKSLKPEDVPESIPEVDGELEPKRLEIDEAFTSSEPVSRQEFNEFIGHVLDSLDILESERDEMYTRLENFNRISSFKI